MDMTELILSAFAPETERCTDDETSERYIAMASDCLHHAGSRLLGSHLGIDGLSRWVDRPGVTRGERRRLLGEVDKRLLGQMSWPGSVAQERLRELRAEL